MPLRTDYVTNLEVAKKRTMLKRSVPDPQSEESSRDVGLLELGFPPLTLVAGRVSVADLHPSRPRRCGIYVLAHADGMHYVGQAVDVVRRFAQHRKVSSDIERFSFFPVERADLDAEERRCIQGAEARGLRLRNRMLVKQLLTESDLDEVLTLAEQEAWLDDPSTFAAEPRLQLDSDQTQRLRFRAKFDRFRADAAFDRVTALVRLYVQEYIPVARRTELSFWSISCLPSTNNAHHPRWVALNVGEMEMFVVGWLPKRREPWGLVNVSRSACTSSLIERLRRRGLVSKPRQRLYRAAGGDDVQLSIDANTFEAMTDALHEPGMTKSARALCLNVMRKRPNLFAKYHCFDLADAVLSASVQ